mgnify:CR=1 FL=1
MSRRKTTHQPHILASGWFLARYCGPASTVLSAPQDASAVLAWEEREGAAEFDLFQHVLSPHSRPRIGDLRERKGERVVEARKLAVARCQIAEVRAFNSCPAETLSLTGPAMGRLYVAIRY